VAAEDDLTRLIETLESLGANRRQLDDLDEETRLRLLRAVGAIARPSREALKDASRARRRARRDGRRTHDAKLVMKTGMRAALRQPVYTAPPEAAHAAAPRERLREPRACYVCKTDFVELHAFYDSLCPDCARLNYARRFPRGDLTGRIALVTGARVKIGFQTAVMLLRQGARVLVTTRFPRDAAQRFAALPDFSGLAGRLHVYGLDLRHIPSVELFAAHLSKRHPHLDILVNNAAQTVRRPAGFYAHLLPLEAQSPDTLPTWKSVLADYLALASSIGGDEPGLLAADRGLLRFSGPRRAVGLTDSAALSQLTTADEAAEGGLIGNRHDAERLFPHGQLDVDLQQVDLRPHNSWRMTAPEVSTGELLEVHLVNAVAPFVLCARLRPLLERSPHDARFIVNVSAMEAQFSRRKKTDKHPHTNMAKAALNMLTRTSAADYAEARIYMNSVDTGWVTDEDPLHHVVRKQEEHRFHPPLDVVDGAARIVDPIFSSLEGVAPPFGLFFKDYRVVPW
jgi:NAD(P)-dependent dehydrogenase (short-subunit alcohol dehydrogenase family)